MIELITIIVFVILATPCHCQQKFAYIAQEPLTVQSNSNTELQVSLTTQANEFLSQTSIQAYLNINQVTSIGYSLIYFNYQTAQGQQCYENWVMNSTQPPTTSCAVLSNASQSQLPLCMNYTQCLNENINFIINLSEELFKQFILIVENTNSTDLLLNTSLRMDLASENTWFYWGVGLTCLLLIALVIYAGIIFYWMLKYKKVKKMFEQFKLTEEEESIKKDN